LNASGGKLTLGVHVSGQFFNGAISDAGIVATAAATDALVTAVELTLGSK